MDLKLELVLIPVSDVDRARTFYAENAGFNLDVDHRAGDDFRVVQLTPPGSACSIAFGVGITETAPGSVRGTHLVVTDIVAARAALVERGVEVSEVRHLESGAWGSRDSFDGSTLFRAWLFRIATNVCLDMLRRSSRRLTAMHSFAEVPWLQPYPDRLLDEVAPSDAQPDAVAVERETIELVFLAAMQVLPPRQRAALIARDVLGWPARETASLLETSVTAANSALQRARATMQEHLPPQRAEWSAGEPSAEEKALLERFIDAHERGDAAEVVAIAAQAIR